MEIKPSGDEGKSSKTKRERELEQKLAEQQKFFQSKMAAEKKRILDISNTRVEKIQRNLAEQQKERIREKEQEITDIEEDKK